MLTQQQSDELAADLAHFTGTDNYWRHWNGRITYTDGVKYLAEKAGAFWLIDVVASYQDERLRKEEFQIWTLNVNRDKRPMAVVTCQADTDEPFLVQQFIGLTDFPLPEIKLWLECGVLMLPDEY